MHSGPARRLRRAPPPTAAEAQTLSLYTKPSGLYASCAWPDAAVRRLILRRALAPRVPGVDDASAAAPDECPICLLHMPTGAMNAMRCCRQRVCTECILQVRTPRNKKVACPFCCFKRVEVIFEGGRRDADVRRELEDARVAEERRVRADKEMAAGSLLALVAEGAAAVGAGERGGGCEGGASGVSVAGDGGVPIAEDVARLDSAEGPDEGRGSLDWEELLFNAAIERSLREH